MEGCFETHKATAHSFSESFLRISAQVKHSSAILAEETYHMSDINNESGQEREVKLKRVATTGKIRLLQTVNIVCTDIQQPC